MPKFTAREGQAVGPSGATVPTHIASALKEVCKTGNVESFLAEANKYDVELRDVQDLSQFKQNLIFSAICAPDEDQAIAMIKLLVERGIDILQKDTLNQTPLYYAARDGKLKLIQLLIEQGI